MTKRKHSTSAPSKHQHVEKNATKRNTQRNSSSSASSAINGFSAPMRRLDQDDEDDEDDVTSRQYDRNHMNEIDRDAEIDDDEEEEDEDEDEINESEEDEIDDEEIDESDDNEADQNDTTDEIDVDESSSQLDHTMDDDVDNHHNSIPLLEYDLPIQLVQGTYSGVLYGLKSKSTLRQLQVYHKKLHSKRGIDDTDMEDENDDGEDDENNDDDEDDEQLAAAEQVATSSGAVTPATSTPAASSFSLLFTNSAHIGSLKSLAISNDGKWMVSGGMDETIKIFQTAKMREFGQLHSHSGSVVALEFYGSSFLLSGGQEGDLCIWSTKTWALLRKFNSAHQGAPGSTGGVSCVSVHPSGRVALSVGVIDRHVKLWDLMKGTCASQRKIDFPCQAVKWAISGEWYVLMGEKRFDIYDTTNKLLRREEVRDTKLLVVTILTNHLIAIGCEDKSIRIHRVDTGECVTQLQGHQARVRGLDRVCIPTTGSSDASSTPSSSSSSSDSLFLASASTDGQTYLWDLTTLNTPEPSPITYHPCCSTYHDQRVTLLKILPHYAARKDDPIYHTPIQIESARVKQIELLAKQSSRPQLTPSEAREAKAKRLFEKTQRKHQRQVAATKARRLLAKRAPGGENDENDNNHDDDDDTKENGVTQPPRKKSKQQTFEVAPAIESDEEEERKTMIDEDEDEDDDHEETNSSKVASHRPAAPTSHKRQSASVTSKPTAPNNNIKKKQNGRNNIASSSSTPAATASSTPVVKNSRPKLSKSQAAKVASSSANVAATSSSKTAPSTSSSSSHAGFSASLPMFKPRLTEQRKKKPSQKKIERDAMRKRAQQNKRGAQ